MTVEMEYSGTPFNTDTLGPLVCVLIRGVSSFQGANNTYLCEVGTWSSVLIREVSFKRGSPVVSFAESQIDLLPLAVLMNKSKTVRKQRECLICVITCLIIMWIHEGETSTCRVSLV